MADTSYKDGELLKIRQEVLMSEKLLEHELKPIIQTNLERYTGTFRPECYEDDWDVIINEFYPILQYNLPSIFYRNPRVFLKPRNKTFLAKKRNPITGEMEQIQMDSQKSARTQENILNYILSEIKYKREVRRTLFDALTAPYGILWHGYKGEFGMTDEQSIFIQKSSLFVKRISPLRFVFDPAVTIANLDEARWVGRSFDIPMQDLVEDDTLDVDKKLVKGKVGYSKPIQESVLQPQNGTGILSVPTLNSKNLSDYASKEFKDSPYSRFVTIYEIFQRPTKKEAREGSKGKVWLLTDEQVKPLRLSKWPYKAEGWPVEILQFNEVQDSMLGLDDISTYADLADQGNIITNQQIRNAKQTNKVWVIVSKNGMSEEDQAKVRDGKNTIILVDSDNVAGQLAVASAAGGSSAELPIVRAAIDLKIDRVSGVTDLKTGIPPKSGEESAASVRERSAGGSARPAYRQDIMADFLKSSCHKLNQYNKQFMTVEEAVRVVGSLDIQWSDNPTQEEIQADTDVDLDITSMLPENPEQELREMQTALALAVQAVTDPSGAVQRKLAEEGYTFELAPLIEQILIRLKIVNPDIFRRIRPEESQGFVAVAEVRNAKANVEAALAGQRPPVTPAPGQDHMAHLETYGTILNLLGPVAPESPAVKILTELMQMHQALLQAEMDKQATAGQKVETSKKMFGGNGIKPIGAMNG